MTFPLGFKVVLRMKVLSPNRVRGLTRGAMMAHIARDAGQRDQAYLEVMATLRSRGIKSRELWPVEVDLTRVSAGALDGDNLIAGFKSCRDGIAKALGFDNDADPRIRFTYGQRRGPKKTYLVEVLVQRAA